MQTKKSRVFSLFGLILSLCVIAFCFLPSTTLTGEFFYETQTINTTTFDEGYSAIVGQEQLNTELSEAFLSGDSNKLKSALAKVLAYGFTNEEEVQLYGIINLGCAALMVIFALISAIIFFAGIFKANIKTGRVFAILLTILGAGVIVSNFLIVSEVALDNFKAGWANYALMGVLIALIALSFMRRRKKVKKVTKTKKVKQN